MSGVKLIGQSWGGVYDPKPIGWCWHVLSFAATEFFLVCIDEVIAAKCIHFVVLSKCYGFGTVTDLDPFRPLFVPKGAFCCIFVIFNDCWHTVWVNSNRISTLCSIIDAPYLHFGIILSDLLPYPWRVLFLKNAPNSFVVGICCQLDELSIVRNILPLGILQDVIVHFTGP